ncbi:MAG: hypothetical protein K1X78_05530 [Verrucomicrobiaceae bacterium]|nr:hypothetical protein [Verrucomicrobiaceae bacterium]
MTDFDQRWQKLARQADGLLDEALPDLPFGCATRVLARSRETVAEPWEDIVSALGLRAIFATVAVGLIAAGFAFADWYEFRIERPAVERTITNDLSWP